MQERLVRSHYFYTAGTSPRHEGTLPRQIRYSVYKKPIVLVDGTFPLPEKCTAFWANVNQGFVSNICCFKPVFVLIYSLRMA